MDTKQQFNCYLQGGNVFRCPDCDVKVRLNDRDLWKAQSYGGPYCTKCGRSIKEFKGENK